jgi:hypothetical protein
VWTYHQKTGNLIAPNGQLAHQGGYSGYGEYRNNPEYEFMKGLGCLPKGFYIIDWAFNATGFGPVVMKLIPNPGNKMYGRSGFLMHGVSVDNPATPEDESLLSSHGCICMPRMVRDQVNQSLDRMLQVIL